MEKQELEILETAFSLFNKYGIRSVSMDDVAREMSISKKTIYKYFENKAELVHRCVESVFSTIHEQVERVHAETQNAIDELFDIDNVVGTIMSNHNPGMHFQLAKYYPETYKFIDSGRQKMIRKMIAENIAHGRKQGLYRSDFESGIITFLYCNKVDHIQEEDTELMEAFDMRKLMFESLIYHIRGISTAAGLTYLEEKLKNNNTNQ
jgi:AcrR family transcriptional regulator